jgi:lipoic acid synthetase
MLGLGETRAELEETLHDLWASGVTVVCLGQYLRLTRAHLPVTRFVAPEEFGEIETLALGLGFTSVSSSPFVRSSYHAELAAAGVPRFTRPPDVGA